MNRNSLLYFSIGAMISTIFVDKLTNVEKKPDYKFKGKNINTILFVFVFLILVKLLQDKKKETKCNIKFCKEKGFCHDTVDVVFGILGSLSILIVSHYYTHITLNIIISFIPILLFIIFKEMGIWNGFID